MTRRMNGCCSMCPGASRRWGLGSSYMPRRLAAPAAGMQILDAADHAELSAEISGTAVNRIALDGDRIARVVRAPGGFAIEHDPARGDLYLRPAAPACRRRR